MVSTIQIKPAPLLQPFVSCYALRVFNTGGNCMLQPLHAVQDYYMTFFLKEQNCSVIDSAGNVKQGASNSLITLLTEPNGYVCWKGDYVVLCVQFKSNGFSAIFGIAPNSMANALFSLKDIIGNDNKLITEELSGCKDIYAMGKCIDAYLLKKLLYQKHSYYTNVIAHIATTILQHKGMMLLSTLASNANISLRTLERNFIMEVGIPPKLYARIIRFHNAVDNKMLHPYKSFTAVAYESGYYDQAHFIKECREFSNKAPEELFKYTPPPVEKYVTKVEY